MTPTQKIKKAILSQVIELNEDINFDGEINSVNVDSLYDELLVQNNLQWDSEDEFRGGATKQQVFRVRTQGTTSHIQ